MDGHGIYAWIVRGIGGIATMLERELAEGTPCHVGTVTMLDLEIERLVKVRDEMQKRSQ